jgi:4-amino-4-deoxy-L-arabinose transferase-like glycosyltransferase
MTMTERKWLYQDDEEQDKEHDEEIKKDRGRKIKIGFWALLGVILLAFLPRFYFLFFKADIQTFGSFWYADVFHHWMIGYLTKEIGLSHGFLRLWDLKGLEYYWGVLHPLLLVGLFKIFGSADILIVRMLSLVCGTISIALVWLIVRRYWNTAAAWGAAIIASFSPIGIFSDASGMTDPLSMMLVLGAIYLWPRKAFWAGTLLALSALNRAEYWLFAFGLVIITLISYRNWDKRGGVVFGWLWLMVLYMKYLLNWTGNPIYPFWQNFLATGRGDWFIGKPLTEKQLVYTAISKGIFFFLVLLAIWLWRKRPRARWLWFFGVMNAGFVSFMLGFTAYKESWLDRIWVDRLWNWPQVCLGIFIAVLVLFWLPERWRWWKKLKLGWLTIAGVVVASQLLWRVIIANDGFVPYKWWFFRPLAKTVAENYKGGSILLPEQADFLAYALYKYNGIEGKHFVGQMFGPFFYIEGSAFANWDKYRETVKNFYTKNDIRLMVLPVAKSDYMTLVEREPSWFKEVGHYADTAVYETTID